MYVVLQAVERINAAVRAGVPENTAAELMNPDAQLPEVYPSAADLYQRELTSLQQQSPDVRTHTHTVSIDVSHSWTLSGITTVLMIVHVTKLIDNTSSNIFSERRIG